MAGDWMKIELALPDKPEVIGIAEHLGIDQDAVVGKLIRIWAWAHQNSIDGRSVSIAVASLDRIACSNGFCEAMREVGWLRGADRVIEFPNFDRHNGQTAKSRALSALRMGKSRSRCDDVTLEAQHSAQPKRNQRREEKIREELPKGSRAKGSPKSDEEFLAGLASDPTYAGINVPEQFGKMLNWCTVNKKEPTHRRFINWLNRADKPMSATAGKTLHQTQSKWGF